MLDLSDQQSKVSAYLDGMRERLRAKVQLLQQDIVDHAEDMEQIQKNQSRYEVRHSYGLPGFVSVVHALFVC